MPEDRNDTPRSAGDEAPSRSSMPPGADDRLLAVIVANMFAGIMLVRASDATILYANPRFAAMFGYAFGELEGRPTTILIAPGEPRPEEVDRRIISDLTTQGVWKGEIENVKKDGTRFWCDVRVTTFEHDDYGTVWVAVQLDISARKHAEAELRRSEERLGLVLEATGAGAWDWNVQTGEVHFSPYWIASLGYAAEEVPPSVAFWEGIVHPDDMPRIRAALARHFEGHAATYECVARLRKKDGTWRWNLDCGRVVEWTPAGEPLRMVGTDTDLSRQRWSGLQEFISICAGCKKIRTEGDHWRAFEEHFGESSLAQFSHGLCPDCIRKLSDGIVESQSPSSA
ncbi:MAG TPA: PAS domain-containing protein [Verrucomicrobiae bacterium]|nr:PAS domain-containing protein [Verrucomicrobiae bacterium]